MFRDTEEPPKKPAAEEHPHRHRHGAADKVCTILQFYKCIFFFKVESCKERDYTILAMYE